VRTFEAIGMSGFVVRAWGTDKMSLRSQSLSAILGLVRG
jgi:hypothetical protein